MKNDPKWAILCALICALTVAPRQAGAQSVPVGTSADTLQIRGTIHTVQKGDTLWDLSQRYLSDAWLWPTVHEANAATIANPHLIYPGQKIWFPVGGGRPVVLSFEEVWPDRNTGMVEAARQAAEVPLPDPEETPGTQPVVTPAPPVTDQPEAYSTGFIAREARYYPLASRNAILAAGHLGNPSDWPDGEIIGGEGAEMNMSLYAQVFLDLGEDETVPGDLYMVVEAGPMVRHPEWGQRLDRMIHIKGIIQIVDTAVRTSQGVLIAVFDEVGLKDRVIPAPEVDTRPWKGFIPVQGGRSGFVVARAIPDGNMHPYEMLFIDGGEEEGVQVGDLYVLKRPETERGRLRFFEQELARVVVIAVQEQTATAMILSLKDSEIGPGEKVELIGRSVFVDQGEEGGG